MTAPRKLSAPDYPSRCPAFRVLFNIHGFGGKIIAREGEIVTLYPDGWHLRRDDGAHDEGGFAIWQVAALTYEARKRKAMARASFAVSVVEVES